MAPGPEEVACRFDAREGPLEMNLLLDTSRPTQAHMAHSLRKGEAYEPEATHLFLHGLRPHDVVIDVGAHVGYFATLAALQVGPRGRVLAIEPDAANRAALQRNLERNGCAEQVTIIDAVVSDRVGEQTFFTNLDNDGGHALWDPGLMREVNRRSAETPQPRTVSTTTIDALAEAHELAQVRFIKIDTEGAEHHVLKGAKQTLKERLVRFVLAELHGYGLERLGTSPTALRGYMVAQGYATWILNHEGCLPSYVPPEIPIRQEFVSNVFFTRPDLLQEIWPVAIFPPPR